MFDRIDDLVGITARCGVAVIDRAAVIADGIIEAAILAICKRKQPFETALGLVSQLLASDDDRHDDYPDALLEVAAHLGIDAPGNRGALAVMGQMIADELAQQERDLADLQALSIDASDDDATEGCATT